MEWDCTVNASYLNRALSPTHSRTIITEAYDFLRRRKTKFDAIVVRGVSGMVIGSPVAYKLKVPLVIVRKADGNHSGQSVEGYSKFTGYVIIDDLVASGDTIQTIRDEISKEFHYPRSQPKMTGLILYQNSSNGTEYANRWDCWVRNVGMSHSYAKKPKTS